MIVVGTSVLVDFGSRHPEAEAALRALNGLLREAAWTDRTDVERECGAVAQAGADGRVVLELADVGCRVTLWVNYELGVVRIASATETAKAGSDGTKSRQSGQADQERGGLPRRPR
ncbi:hypothetical protein [Rhodoligotrophos defluvii]|uniref:hypothetical protein n=1 Tax=Rhodoligotrophos defluvii TaxID=2561934 RepID=UPI0010C9BE9C|nr:hypothetical protein [Rhodoligotrophos defluvii]